MNRMPGRGVAHEVAGAAARFEHRGVIGHAEAGRIASCMACMTIGEVKNWLNAVRRAESYSAAVRRDLSSSPRACQPASL